MHDEEQKRVQDVNYTLEKSKLNKFRNPTI